MTPLSLLAPYQALVQQHQDQFSLPLNQLHATVETTLHQLRQQEQPLVAAQIQALASLRAQLSTNARCLLGSAELTAFVTEVQTLPRVRPWNRTTPTPDLVPDTTDWHLAQTDFTLAIHDYESVVDHNAYDDERTHTTYGYQIAIQIGDQRQPLTVITERCYSPIERRSYDLRTQLAYDFEYGVADLIKPLAIAAAHQAQLIQEISHLCCCAVRLLALTPQSVQFQYATEPAARAVKAEVTP